MATRTVPHLVIGSGIAGLTLALKLARWERVLLVAKGPLQESNTYHAQGGIAAVFGGDDSFAEHQADTMAAGRGLCRESVVRRVTEAGPRLVRELIGRGVRFTQEGGQAHLTREGGHSRRRVLHAADETGKEVVRALVQAVIDHPRIETWEHHLAVDLLCTDKIAPDFSHNRCLGAYVLDLRAGEIRAVASRTTHLCTGGQGRLYIYTSNPIGATGDGLAMAWRAGCKVANLEFVQFHPTCLFHARRRSFLISEALRGEGAVLTDSGGRPFMKRYHPAGSLAPRDVVARAIDSEIKNHTGSCVYLDARAMGRPKLASHFPHIYDVCRSLGIDIATDLIPVVPAAHYSCGGVVVDEAGRTSISNLFAIGEVACSGLHGANRLASNSLLEALVLADAAATAVHEDQQDYPEVPLPEWNRGEAIPSDEQVVLSHTWDEIRRLMWYYVGIVRSDKRLGRALSRIVNIRQELEAYYWTYEVDRALIEVRNLADVAWLTVRCAMARKESRGSHYNLDHPEEADVARDTVIR